MSTLLRALFVLLALLGAPGAAQAQAPAQVMPSAVPSEAVVGVVVIRASNPDAPRLDPRLASVAGHLQKLPFRAFELVAEHRWRLHDRGRQDVAMPDGRTITLVLQSHGPEEARVAVSSRRPGAEPIETVLTIKRDRAFLYALKTGADTALLVRVDVHY